MSDPIATMSYDHGRLIKNGTGTIFFISVMGTLRQNRYSDRFRFYGISRYREKIYKDMLLNIHSTTNETEIINVVYNRSYCIFISIR